MSGRGELFWCILSAYEQRGIADNSLQTQQRDPHFIFPPVEHTSLVHPGSFPCYVSWVQVSESCYPLLSCLIFWTFFLAKFSNQYHGAHAESEGCFTLAPKMTPNPNVKQLSTTDKVSFSLSSAKIQRPNGFSDKNRDMISLVVDLLY